MPIETRHGLKKRLEQEKIAAAAEARRQKAAKRREEIRKRRDERLQLNIMEEPTPPAKRIDLNLAILTSVLKRCDYPTLMNCQLVNRHWNKTIQSFERVLPKFISEGAIMDAETFKTVMCEPTCELTCVKKMSGNKMMSRLVGTSALIAAEGGTDFRMHVPRRVVSTSWSTFKNRRASSVLNETSTWFRVHVGETIDKQMLPSVLHWFRHLRDHQFYFEEVVLRPFNMALWRASVIPKSHYPDVIRCRTLTLKDVDMQEQRDWAQQISTKCVSEGCELLCWKANWADINELDWLINFFLTEGANTRIPKFVIENNEADQDLIDELARIFEKLPTTDGMFPEVCIPILDQTADERDLMVGNLLSAGKDENNFDTLLYSYTNLATNAKLLVSMRARSKALATARTFEVTIRPGQ